MFINSRENDVTGQVTDDGGGSLSVPARSPDPTCLNGICQILSEHARTLTQTAQCLLEAKKLFPLLEP